MTRIDRWLTWMIRLNAFVLLLAVIPIFFPTELMVEMHERFGLGQLSRDRITEYLTRSASACYAMHGAVLLLLASDVRRYRMLIDGLYLVHFAFAMTMLGIDLYAGMPGWWTLAEVGTISVVAIIIFGTNQLAKRFDAISQSA
jgi:hypothetical protein